MDVQDYPQTRIIWCWDRLVSNVHLLVFILCIALASGCARTAKPQLIENRSTGNLPAPVLIGKTVELLPPIVEYVSLRTELQLDSRHFGADEIRREIDSQSRKVLSDKGATALASGGSSRHSSLALNELSEVIGREFDVVLRKKMLGPESRRLLMQSKPESTASLFLVTRLFVKAEGFKSDVPFRSESGRIDLMLGDIDPKLSTSELTGILVDTTTGGILWFSRVFVRRLVLGNDVDELVELLYTRL